MINWVIRITKVNIFIENDLQKKLKTTDGIKQINIAPNIPATKKFWSNIEEKDAKEKIIIRYFK